MEQKVVLSKKNCHRAAVVQNISNPEWGTFKFNYKEQELPNKRFTHTIGVGSNSRILDQSEFNGWEVVSWKYAVSLEEYWDLAYRAYAWTSFDPDKAGERTIISYERELNGDLENIPAEEQERYINNYKKHFSAWLSAHSNCASSAITGGSGFNVRRAEKANNREHARMGDFIQWREKALKAIARKKEDSKPENIKRAEAWESLERDLRHSAAVIEGINKGIEPYSKQLFVSSIYNKVETYAKHGDVDMVDRAISLIRELNQHSSIITERHKFFKLPELAAAVKEKLSDLKEADSKEIPFDGGKVVKNFSEDRIQIIFDSKPAPDVISKLKSNGFRWSPRFTAWQRQLTTNGCRAVSVVVPVSFQQLIN